MYRTIDVKMWTDPQFKQLDPIGKLVFVYLVTNPHGHVSGIYYLPKVVAAHETGVDGTLLDTVYDTLSSLELASFDVQNEVVWVRNMYRHQSRGPKAIAAAQSQLANLHNSCLCHDFCEKYPEVADGVDLPPLDTVSVGYPAQNGLVPIGEGLGEGLGEGSGSGEKPSCRSYRFDEEDMAFAVEMREGIENVIPNPKPCDLDKWAQDVRLMRENDDRTIPSMQAVFRWANADEFWRLNVLSPAKFRKQFDTISAKMGAGPNGRQPKPPGAGVKYDPDAKTKDPNHGKWE